MVQPAGEPGLIQGRDIQHMSAPKGFSVQPIIKAIRGCLPPRETLIGLHEPVFAGREWEYVRGCLDAGWVSSVGKYVDKFERMLEEYTGARRAVAVVNGTAALHICLKLAGVGAGDEVILPALTFVATANAVTYTGAVPHLVDIEARTLGLDPLKLEKYLGSITRVQGGQCTNRHTGRRIKAVVPVHTFGHPVDLDPLLEVCRGYRLELVEDAAESLGSFYKGRHTGTLGKLSALSFNGNKIITTGGGGAILTGDPGLGESAKHLTTTAKLPHPWAFNHDQVGYNYRLPNLNAALGCAQLEQLPRFLRQKRELAESYRRALAHVPGVKFFTEPGFARSNYWLNTIILAEEYAPQRDTLLEETNKAGIMTRPPWTLMHRLPMFQGCPRSGLEVAQAIETRAVNIPSSPGLATRS